MAVLDELARILRSLGMTNEADEALTRATDLAHKYPEEDGQNDQ